MIRMPFFVVGIFMAATITEGLSKPEDVYAIIQEIQIATCGKIERSGSSFKVQGDAEIKVGTLMKKLVDLGVNGAAKIDSEEYVGVIREEVGKDIQSTRQCNMKIWDDLKFLMNDDKKSTDNNKSQINIRTYGPISPVITGDNNETNIGSK